MALLRKTAGLPALLASELFLTSERDLEVLREAQARRHHRGAGFQDPRLLRQTEPPAVNTNAAQAAIAAADRQTLGTGVLDVRISVDDQRVGVASAVSQPMSLVKINPGHTNPGSYR